MVRLRGLGECVFEIGSTTLTPESSTVFALLLYLARHSGDLVPRDRLLSLFWPSTDEDTAGHRLRQNVYRLRRLGAVVHTRPDGVQLDAQHAEADQAQIYITAELLEAGIHEQRLGVFLPGYVPQISPQFDAWVDAERTVVGLELRNALLGRLMEARTRGRYAEVERLARRCLLLDPLNEEATLALAEATALRGSKVEAVRMVDEYLTEIGPGAGELRIAPMVLRKRISERLGVLESPTAEPRFTGRERELEVLTVSLRRARNGNAVVCALSGEPGVGKSRVLREFARSSSLHAFRILSLEAQAGDEKLPLGAFVHLVPQLLRLPGSLACSAHSLESLRQIHVYDHAQADDDRSQPETPYSHARIRRSLYEIFDTVTTECSLLIHIDDAHHLDTLSRSLLGELVSRFRSRRLMVVMTARTMLKSPPPWFGLLSDDLLREIEVQPLDDTQAAELLTHMCEIYGARLPEAERALCLQHGSGNPVMLRELVISLALGTLDSEDHPTLGTLLSQRIARVNATCLRVLQACALLRNHCTLDALDSALEYPAYQLLQAIEHLEGAGLLRVERDSYECRHELIISEVLAVLGPSGRRLLHRRVAVALEAKLGPSPSVALLWDVTQQWLLAEDADRAIQFAAVFSSHLCGIGMHVEALTMLDKAAALARDTSHEEALLAARVLAHSSAGNWRRVVESLEASRSLKSEQESGNNSHSPDELRLLEAHWRFDPNRVDLLEQVVTCALAENASPSHRLAAVALGLSIADNAGNGQCAEHLYSSIGTVALEGDFDRRALAHIGLIYHSSFGDLTRARAEGERLRGIVNEGGPKWMLAQTLRWLATPTLRLGSFDDATTLATEALALHERASQLHGYAAACDLLSHIAFASGDLRKAKSWGERFLSSGREHGLPTMQLGGSVAVCRAALLLNQTTTVKKHAAFVRTQLPHVTVSRARAKCLAVLLHTAFTCSLELDLPNARTELGSLLSTLAPHGDQDYCQAVYARSLAPLGDALVHDTWQVYCRTQRREKYKAPDHIVRIMNPSRSA